MNEPRTREIQLTAKQLVFVFMSTLLVAVVVFLLGVWVGRGMGEDTSVADRRTSAPGPASDTTMSARGDAGKLTYPDVLQGGRAGQAPGKTQAEPPVPAPASSPQPSPPPATPPPTPPPTTNPPARDAGKDDWVVQLDAFSSKANADRMAAELKSKGYAAFVTPGPLFKVRVGPFAKREAADQMAARLRKEPSQVSKGFAPRVISTR